MHDSLLGKFIIGEHSTLFPRMEIVSGLDIDSCSEQVHLATAIRGEKSFAYGEK